MTEAELQEIRERSVRDSREDDGHGWPNQAEYEPAYMRLCIEDRAKLLAFIDELRAASNGGESHAEG